MMSGFGILKGKRNFHLNLRNRASQLNKSEIQLKLLLSLLPMDFKIIKVLMFSSLFR